MTVLRKVHINGQTWKYKVLPSGMYIYSPHKPKGAQPDFIENPPRSFKGMNSPWGAVTPASVKEFIEITYTKTKSMPNLVDQHQSGTYGKFTVERRDGRDRKYGDRTNADYFVLDLTYDPFAKIALLAYIKACEAEYPQLAVDLRRKLK